MSMKERSGTISGMDKVPTTITPPEKFILASGSKIYGMEEAPTLYSQEKYASTDSGNEASCMVKPK